MKTAMDMETRVTSAADDKFINYQYQIFPIKGTLDLQFK